MPYLMPWIIMWGQRTYRYAPRARKYFKCVLGVCVHDSFRFSDVAKYISPPVFNFCIACVCCPLSHVFPHMLSYIQRSACDALANLSCFRDELVTSSIIAGGGIERLKRAQQMYEKEWPLGWPFKTASQALRYCDMSWDF